MNEQNHKRKILCLALGYDPESYIVPNEDAIYACVDPSPELLSTNRVLSLPSGKFEIQRILDQLPNYWKPDLIFVSSSLVMTPTPPIPIGLEKLDYPSAMKLTDSHHTSRPIQKLIEYSQTVGCRFHWTIYDRHHLHFFKEAGLANPFWMPGSIAIPNYDSAILQTTRLAPKKLYETTFSGGINSTHFYRSEMLTRLENRGVNVSRISRPSYTDYLKTFAESEVVLNFSLNGDLNRRLFEVLLAGGFLLTDRLPPESGLPLLFQEGIDFEGYSSEQELIDKINYFLKHPDQAAEIAENGHQKLINDYHPDKIREEFWNFVVKGEPLPDLYVAKEDSRIIALDQTGSLNHRSNLKQRIITYEFFQELQRANLTIELLCYQCTNKVLVSNLKDLYRIKLVFIDSLEELASCQQKQFQIVMADFPSSQQSLKTQLNLLNSYISENGLLILAGKHSKRFDRFLKHRNLVAVALRNTESRDYSIYQKKEADQLSIRTFNLNFPQAGKRASLPTRFFQKIKRFVKK